MSEYTARHKYYNTEGVWKQSVWVVAVAVSEFEAVAPASVGSEWEE